MAFDFLGDDRSFFMKSSWDVYCNASGARQYVGKTSNEKEFNPNIELAEWWSNSSGTQSLFVLDVDKFDFSMGFSFMQVCDPNVLAMAWNMELDSSDGTYHYLFGGSEPAALTEAEWRFVGRSRTGLEITLVVRKGICVPSGAFTSGAPGEFAGVPVTVRALQDTTITDKSRDMVYFRIAKKSYS